VTGSLPSAKDRDASAVAGGAKLTRAQAHAKARSLAMAMSADEQNAFIMECAGSDEKKVHNANIAARQLQKLLGRKTESLMAAERQALAQALHFYLMADQIEPAAKAAKA